MATGFFYVWDVLVLELSKEAIFLLVAGMLVYFIGIAFFIMGEFKPIYHTIWHLCVILAAALHWFDVYLFVISVNLDISESPTKLHIVELVETIEDYSVTNVAASVVNMVNQTMNAYTNL